MAPRQGQHASAAAGRVRGIGRGAQSAGDTDDPAELYSARDISEGLDQSSNPLVQSARISRMNSSRPQANAEQPPRSAGIGVPCPSPNLSHGTAINCNRGDQRLQSKDRVRYLHIPRHSLKDFQRFARDAAVEAQCELAVENPYVQALVNYRAEMQAFAIAPAAAVPSVEQMLGTHRDNLSLLTHTGANDASHRPDATPFPT
eukprot:NODE_18390_length_895_cov_5.196615.p1 GENE.NODE_18390_length_895_cov_5.196615~~NODE_18390_length_895_cov_5.196615.p1  ORF type:complete len:235 (+),score=60.43 NODE_18390_length_895_cov_5.196615:100-705(+)